MPFQSTVNPFQTPGFAGGWGSGNIYAASAFIAAEDVAAGAFVTEKAGSDPAAVAPGATGDAQFLGIVLRARTGLIADPAAEASAVINRGLPVEVLTQGDAVVALANQDADALEPGMAIFAAIADGSPRADVGDADVPGHRKTRWKLARLLDARQKTALVSTW